MLAIVALLFQNRIWDWWQERKLYNDSRPQVAKLSSIYQNVRIRLPESLTYHHARESMPLHAKDTVSTDINSRAVITFNTGLEVELEPNSLITIEDIGKGGDGSLELTFQWVP